MSLWNRSSRSTCRILAGAGRALTSEVSKAKFQETRHLWISGNHYKGQGMVVGSPKSVPRAGSPRAVKSLDLHFKENIHDSSNCLPLFPFHLTANPFLYPLTSWNIENLSSLCELNIPAQQVHVDRNWTPKWPDV